jgi:hypothetical protein
MLEKLFKFIEPDFESVLDINQFPLPGRRLPLAACLARLPQEFIWKWRQVGAGLVGDGERSAEVER